MRRTVLAVLSILLVAADPLEGDKFLEKADEKFEQAGTRAQDAYAKAIRDAFETRLRTYRSILAAATKSGDFDRATAIKERIGQLEIEREEVVANAPGRKKAAKIPKDAVEVGNHTFALFKNLANWHVAKRRCEEMGGHLATFETDAEREAVLDICQKVGNGVWLGATDEEVEGQWHWVTGGEITPAERAGWRIEGEDDHALVFWPGVGLGDGGQGWRGPFLCEWDK